MTRAIRFCICLFLFRKIGSTWTSVDRLQTGLTGELDGFGFAVAVGSNGNALVVGAPVIAGPSNSHNAAYLFETAPMVNILESATLSTDEKSA